MDPIGWCFVPFDLVVCQSFSRVETARNSVPGTVHYHTAEMSEYWVATPKRYCDACKCYISDDKTVIQVHEAVRISISLRSAVRPEGSFLCEFPTLVDVNIRDCLHFQGKRHKENVAKRLEATAKKGAERHAEQTAYDKQMAAIENAALEAMKKDGCSMGESTGVTIALCSRSIPSRTVS